MKKLLIGLFVFSFLFIGFQVNATDEGCSSGTIFNSITGAKCPVIHPICPANMPNPFSLCTDGKIEPATKDANQCVTLFKCVNSANDVGCLNGTIFNSITGAKCPVVDVPIISTDNDGCNGTIFSSTTGKACSSSTIIDAGCHGAKYSLTTGQLCPFSTLTTEAGCVNNEIYSSTTGLACPVDQGCNGTIFSSTTGKACPSSTIIDAGCHGAKFSLTTGQLCPFSTLTTEAGCVNNEIYSSTTGLACPVDQGCNGTIFSSTTGKVCINYKEKEQNTDSNNLPKTTPGSNNLPKTVPSNNLPPKTASVIRRTLKFGVKGDDVKTLQTFLNLFADGSFGTNTRAKVMEWQKANGLTPDGTFGSISRQKANLAE